jgi:hypothetical protein
VGSKGTQVLWTFVRAFSLSSALGLVHQCGSQAMSLCRVSISSLYVCAEVDAVS